MASTKRDTVGENRSDSLLERLIAKGAVEINLDRTMYSADKVGDPVVGFIVDLLDMPPIQVGKQEPRDWQAFVVLLTEPCRGVDRNGDIIEAKAGEEMVVPATYQIQHALKRFAKDPEKMHELGIMPKKKLDIGAGQTFWTYRVVSTGTTKARGSVYALPGAPVPKQVEGKNGGQLPPHDPETGEVLDTQPAENTARA